MMNTPSWTTLICECGIGFQVESINALGLEVGSMKGKISCPFCQSKNVKRLDNDK